MDESPCMVQGHLEAALGTPISRMGKVWMLFPGGPSFSVDGEGGVLPLSIDGDELSVFVAHEGLPPETVEGTKLTPIGIIFKFKKK